LLLSVVFPASLFSVQPARTTVRLPEIPVGQTLKPCVNCPEFVRVPKAPAAIRNIQFVAKYELTWKQYLAAVDEKACPPPSASIIDEGQTRRAADYLDELRVDWAVSLYTKAEVDCFAKWLVGKAGLPVAVPTAKEWEWFARGSMTSARFPWGDEEANPPAAVQGVAIADEDERHTIKAIRSSRMTMGVRVGLFPPNSWGLYDLIGNMYELTSTSHSGEEWSRMYPVTQLARRDENIEIKGHSRWFSRWKKGIAAPPEAVFVEGGRFSHHVTVRYVIIQGDAAGAANPR
jgi:hypothetical protein